MKKVPANDFFVLKGSIFLIIATAVRIGSCIYLFIEYMLYLNNNFDIKHKKAYGVVLTEMTFDVPITFLLLTFYSLLFSTYKLYLVLQEMLAFSLTI